MLGASLWLDATALAASTAQVTAMAERFIDVIMYLLFCEFKKPNGAEIQLDAKKFTLFLLKTKPAYSRLFILLIYIN